MTIRQIVMRYRIIFTKHALQKLQERQIPKRSVIETVLRPDQLVADGLKSYAFRRFGRICLKVIFVRDGNLIKIITQHFVDEP